MNCKAAAQRILDSVGGASNVKDVSHCFTRLRLVLRNPGIADKAAVERTEGVVQVVESGGQFQIVLGGNLNKVYDEFLQLYALELQKKTENERRKVSLGQSILQAVSDIFTPVAPAMAAAGLIKAILIAVSRLSFVDSSGSTYVILFAASNIIFYFLPVFLAYTTAKAVKCSVITSMVLGAFLCYPQIDALVQNVAERSAIFGFPVIKTAFTIGNSTEIFSYTESVIPIILSVLILSFIEKGLKKIIPAMLHVILVPGLSLIIMLPVMLAVVGPIGEYIGYSMQWLYGQAMNISPVIGGAIVGGLWSVFIVLGAHKALLPTGLNDVEMSAALHSCGAGHNTLMCYAAAAKFSQAGAALGVMLKTKNKEAKPLAGAAAFSAFLSGITEPAIYVCNLRLKRPLLCAAAAGALGGAVMGIGRASNHGFSSNGILSIPSFYCSDNTLGMFLSYLIGIAIAFFGALILTCIVGFDDSDSENSFE